MAISSQQYGRLTRFDFAQGRLSIAQAVGVSGPYLPLIPQRLEHSLHCFLRNAATPVCDRYMQLSSDLASLGA
jgi:hypothetical protein